MTVLVQAVDRPDVAPCVMPDRFRHDIAYFMRIPGEAGVPRLASGEFWIDLSAARSWLEDGVVSVVSPLDSENRTEIELTQEQEDWLEWLVANQVQHVRLA